MHKPEFKLKGEGTFRLIEQYELNSLVRNVDSQIGVRLSPNELYTILASDFSQKADPLVDYFTSLPQNVTEKTIEELASCVETTESERWVKFFKKWLVAVVANALELDRCCNHICLVLYGKQGIGKTSFLNHLCPPALKRYLYIGGLNFSNKGQIHLPSA